MSLALLFDTNDKIFVANVDEFGTKHEFIGNVFEVEQALLDKPRSFFCISPLRGQRRQKSEISRYTNFMFESDSTPLAQQFALLPTIMELGIVRAATYSGGKSIHFLVSALDDLQIGEPGSEAADIRYKAIWTGIANSISQTGLIIDTAGNNAVTLSRIPGQFRDGTEQTLLYTGTLVESSFLQNIAINKVKAPKAENSLSSVKNIEELEQRLNSPNHSKLASYIKYPSWISRNSGNYPMLLRLSLWAIEEAGATSDTLLPVFEKYLQPHLHNNQYYKDWQVPVIHALRMKGML